MTEEVVGVRVVVEVTQGAEVQRLRDGGVRVEQAVAHVVDVLARYADREVGHGPSLRLAHLGGPWPPGESPRRAIVRAAPKLLFGAGPGAMRLAAGAMLVVVPAG